MTLRFPKPPKRESKPRKRIARGKRPRRRSKSPLAVIEDKLWKLFAAYVKERDGNVCASCPAVGLVGRNWHAGHMIASDRHPGTRYDPKNVHSQCARCNKWLRGNGSEYALRFLDRYGAAEFERLNRKAKEMRQWREHELAELIEALERGGADYETFYMEKYGL